MLRVNGIRKENCEASCDFYRTSKVLFRLDLPPIYYEYEKPKSSTAGVIKYCNFIITGTRKENKFVIPMGPVRMYIAISGFSDVFFRDKQETSISFLFRKQAGRLSSTFVRL